MHVYSTPMTPPPTTINVLGSSAICRIWSLVRMLRLFSGTFGDSAGLVPVAMTMAWPSRSVWPCEPWTRMWCGSTKLAVPQRQVHAVAGELSVDDVGLRLDHVQDPERQVRHGDLLLHPVVDAVDVLVEVAGEVEDRLPHRLAGDRAGVGADPAHHLLLLDEGHAFAGLGALDGGPLAARAGADHDEVVALHVDREGSTSGRTLCRSCLEWSFYGSPSRQWDQQRRSSSSGPSGCRRNAPLGPALHTRCRGGSDGLHGRQLCPPHTGPSFPRLPPAVSGLEICSRRYQE